MKKYVVLAVVVILFGYISFSEEVYKSDVSMPNGATNTPIAVNRNKFDAAKNVEVSTNHLIIPDESATNNSFLEPEIKAALEEMSNTSSEGLVEEQKKNSFSVDLQGRFQTIPVATIREDGQLEIKEYSSVPK